MTAKAAFIGLGVMGFPMAGHLTTAGHDVTVYNRTAAKAQDWVAQARRRVGPDAARRGARAASSCSSASATTTTCARSCSGRTAPSPAWRRARSSSTTRPPRPTSRASCTAGAGRAGCAFIDAPVSGGQAGAENGKLTVMCGGDAAPFDAPKPVDRRLRARRARCMGASGAGQLAKMVNQICIAGLVQGLAGGASHFAREGRARRDRRCST